MARRTTARTHAMRLLDARGIGYEVTVYDASGAFHSAAEAAALLALSVECIDKTLAVARETGAHHRPIIVMAPAEGPLDLRAFAHAIAEKGPRLATQREAESLTGMQAGGICALGLPRPEAFGLFIDAWARELRTISVSAGRRGVELRLAARDLVALSGARFVRTSPPAGPGSTAP